MTKSRNINIKWDINKAKELFSKNGLSLLTNKYTKTTDKMLAETKEGYKVIISINKLVQGRKPSIFCNGNPYTIENLNLYFKTNDIKSEILSKEIKNQTQDISFKCECGKVFTKKLVSILKNNTCRCNECAVKSTHEHLYLTENDIKNNVEKNSKLKFISIVENNKNQESLLKLKCECGNEFIIRYRKLREKKFNAHCKECTSKIMGEIKYNESLNSLIEYLNNEATEYELIKYNGSRDKSIFKHKKCGNVFKMREDTFKIGCRCGCEVNSKGERKIIDILINNNVEFIPQKTFNDCRSKKGYLLRYDFYLPKYDTCIEYDGEFHYKEINLRSTNLEYQKENDNIKDEYCNKNNIKLLRIPYWKFDEIENILKSVI